MEMQLIFIMNGEVMPSSQKPVPLLAGPLKPEDRAEGNADGVLHTSSIPLESKQTRRRHSVF